ncbi:hypothetical protein [Methanosarcina horonobensis]|uniref:hypothetical protein n=1 Tax=Methanosarcina horonobensis TaxID=418008 RepID=UPI000B011B28|nr:hypothetical protein [Methanosarcina horonobensis]
MRAYKKKSGSRTKKTTGVSLAILAAGLLLTTFNINILDIDIGYYLLWAGVFVFFVTSMQGLFAAGLPAQAEISFFFLLLKGAFQDGRDYCK